MPALHRELGHAWRRLRRAPAFSITAAIVLTLGIGATATVFSVIDGILLRPLPYSQPERLFRLIHSTAVPGASRLEQSDGTFLLYQRHVAAFDGIGAYREYGTNVGIIGGVAADAKRVSATGVTAGLFTTLGVAPARGRGFTANDDRKDSPHVVLISDGLWKNSFGADKSIVGRRVLLDGVQAEIIGVMPPALHFPSAAVEIWEPLRFDPAHAQAGSFNFTGIGRLKPGVTPDAAVAEMNRVLPRLLDEFPSDIPKDMWTQAKVRSAMSPLRESIVGDVGRMLWTLFGAVALVLVIACANVANLFLVRAEGRQRELAVRSALGAGRATLVAQHLGESVVLASIGGTIGILLAWFGVRVLASLPAGMDLPRLSEVRVDARVIVFSLFVTLLSAIAVSLFPLIRARRIAISAVLKESGRSATAGAARQRARGAFVIIQVAMGLVLIAASGLMARSFSRLRDVRTGFDAKDVVAMRVALPAVRYPNAVARLTFYQTVLNRVAALPGVRGVGFTSWLPLTDDNNTSLTEIQDRPAAANSVPGVHSHVTVTNEYLAAMRTPLLAGRAFGPPDPARPLTEALVSRAFAEKYWKGESPIGKRIRPGITGPWFDVVGVVADVHLHSLDAPAEEAVYFPMVIPENGVASVEQYMALVVRADGDPNALSPMIRKIVHELDPALPTYGERTMTSIVGAATARTRFIMMLLGVASGIALLLGAVGIYGVMAYGVSVRQREIGVRMALGARPRDVSWMISRQGVTLAGVGVLVGILASLATTRVLRGLLYDVSPADPLVLAGASAALLGATLLASWLPARRAAAVDPADALRAD